MAATVEGKTHCERCLRRKTEIQLRYRARCKKLGICEVCGNQAVVPGLTRCAGCRAEALLEYTEKRARRREQGLCHRCGVVPPESGSTLCKGCRYARRSWSLRKYGLTREEFEGLLLSQGHRCANPGCRTPDPGDNGDWHVDHDHVTGEVRGILCHHCNTAIGLLEDSQERAAGLAKYLAKRAQLRLVGPSDA